MSIASRPTLEAVRAHREEILRIAAAFGAHNVRIFGSVARGDADAESDVDVLVDMDRNPGGLEYFGRLDDLRTELHQLLGVPVDVVDAMSLEPLEKETPAGRLLRAQMRERVLRDQVPL